VSLSERYARIVADAGFDARVSQAEWRTVIDALGAAMRRGEREAALKSAAVTLGEVLAQRFPSEAGQKPTGEVFHIVR
jgi:uncharacterized membrane protein